MGKVGLVVSDKNLSVIRNEFYESLFARGIFGTLAATDSRTRSSTISDDDSNPSREIGYLMAESLGAGQLSKRASGQTSGKVFEECVAEFLTSSLSPLSHLAPGGFSVERVKMRKGEKYLSKHVPYRHLEGLANLIRENSSLESVVGNIYEVDPDVVVYRRPFSDSELESQVESFLADGVAQLSKVRLRGTGIDAQTILHAVVSCKWTLRSDRAQNARSEALGLIRNRKGRLPHICVVTAEPLPSRIQSLAMGTGDIDAVYHISLGGLRGAIEQLDSVDPEQIEALNSMVVGGRLKDISDLPIDLLV